MSELLSTRNGFGTLLGKQESKSMRMDGEKSVRTRSIPLPIRFPDNDFGNAQDAEWCEVYRDGTWQRIRFHDYAAIYRIPGLYEQLFCSTLHCCSHAYVPHLLAEVLTHAHISPTSLRVLDFGAGNGMVGEELRCLGVSALVGADILKEAAAAARRDRPGLYDDYLVADMTAPPADMRTNLMTASLNCLVTVAALGFGDIPPRAFANAFNCITPSGWVAFNIKETFFRGADDTGFFRLLRSLWENGILELEAFRRYVHRRSVAGKPLHYVALVGRKTQHLPEALIDAAEQDSVRKPALDTQGEKFRATLQIPDGFIFPSYSPENRQ